MLNAKADVLLRLAFLEALRRSRILWRNSYGRQCLGSTSVLKRCKRPLEPKIRSHNTGLNSYSWRQSQCEMTIPILHQKRLRMICKNGWMISQGIKWICSWILQVRHYTPLYSQGLSFCLRNWMSQSLSRYACRDSAYYPARCHKICMASSQYPAVVWSWLRTICYPPPVNWHQKTYHSTNTSILHDTVSE